MAYARQQPEAFAVRERDRPVRDWLDALKWDGILRIETWTSGHLGALWLISAAARIYRPGVKADHMLISEGPQGVRKSTALKVLAGEKWFTDELPELGSTDAALHMQGVWIAGIAELDATGRAEVSRIEAFLTRTTDRFRPPYGRYSVEVPRQCVRRHREPRHLSARRDRQPAFLVGPLRDHRYRGARPRPGSGAAVQRVGG